MRKGTLAAGLAVLVLLGACGGTDDAEPSSDETNGANSYEANGIAFEYPRAWEEVPGKFTTSTGSNELWSVTVGPDRTNLVIVTAYRLNIEITEENLASIEGELDAVIQDVVDEAGGEVTAGPTAAEIAGLPTYTYAWEGVDVAGEEKDSSAYFLFNGDLEYFVNCQYSDETADEVKAGCDQILDSFALTQAR